MEASNTTPTTTYWLCPLYSFNCDCDSVDLAEGIQIKAAPSKLQEYLKERTPHLYGLRSNLSDVDWAAFLPYRRRNVEGLSIDEGFLIGLEEYDRDRNSFVDLVTALRLYRSGRLVAGPLIFASIHDFEWSVGSSTIWTPVSELNFFQEEPKYALYQSDVPEVNKLLQSVRQWRETSILDTVNIALTRFHSAYHGNIEDRIIDQMIAFESLYIGDERGIKNNLALRTASLLGESQELRERIFNDMKYAYKRRCDIVHVVEHVTREELQGIVPKTEEYLRQSIRKFIELLFEGYSLEDLKRKIKELAKLDEHIFPSGKLLPSK